MQEPLRWNDWVEQYDVFISYARADNTPYPGTISAFVDALEEDFRQFSPSVPLQVFFDKTAIVDGELWENKLKKGLRQSKVMIAFLSEAYFKSQWCRNEWEEYILVEQSRTYPGEALTPIFIVGPTNLSEIIPASARDWWANVTARNAVVELVDYWDQGASFLQEELVKQRLHRLNQNIHRRVELGRLLAQVPRNLSGRNPNFVGRQKQLAELRTQLARTEGISAITAVNGVGGIGKSSTAREYAYLFRPEYLGGQFEIDLSTVSDFAGIQSALVTVARNYLRVEIPRQIPEPEQYMLAKAAFENLPHTPLIIFDNLNEDATQLVGLQQRRNWPNPEKVHYLITTRAEPSALGGIGSIRLDVLAPAEALDLLFRYRAFARQLEDPDYLAAREGHYEVTEVQDWPHDQEWKAAISIINRLGRHSLAVALVGAYLGSYPSITYQRFAHDMGELGIGLALEHIGNDAKVQNLIDHPQLLIRPLLEQSLRRLSPLAVRVLQYAAFLPPDLVPINWLKALVQQDADMADALKQKPFQPEPWAETLRTLDGLDYLQGAPYARMHRVVQEVVQGLLTESERERFRQRVLAWIERRTIANWDSHQKYDDLKEIEAVVALIRNSKKNPERRMGQCALWLVGIHMTLGKLSVAKELAELALQIAQRLARSDPGNAAWQRDLFVSLNKLGDLAVAQGNLPEAQRLFAESLRIAQRLAESDPGNAAWQRDLSVSLNKLGELAVAQGNLTEAQRLFAESLRISQRLAESDPGNAAWQRDLSVSLEKLGDLAVAQGNLPEAQRLFAESLRIAQRLAESDPGNAAWQRDLSVSLDRLGDLAVAQGNLPEAQRLFAESLRIIQRLAESDPGNAEWQRDLSVLLNKLGNLAVAQGNLPEAQRHFAESLRIIQRLAESDPGNAAWQRDLSVSMEKMAKVSHQNGEPEKAYSFQRQALAISTRLAEVNPTSAELWRTVWVHHAQLAQIYEQGQDTKADTHWRSAHDILAGMLARGLHVSPQDLRYLDHLKRKLST
jgi:tetratricopeptide (TPR) repeat protein